METRFERDKLVCKKTEDGYLFLCAGKIEPQQALVSLQESGRDVPASIYTFSRPEDIDAHSGRLIQAWFDTLPMGLEILAEGNPVASFSKKKLNQLLKEPKFTTGIDNLYEENGRLFVQGWSFYDLKNPVQAHLEDGKGNRVEAEISMSSRKDVEVTFGLASSVQPGFIISAPSSGKEDLHLVLSCLNHIERISLNGYKTRQLLFSFPQKSQKAARYLKKRGWKAARVRLEAHARRSSERQGYHRWIMSQQPSAAQLEQQAKTRFAFAPLYSLIVAAYNTPLDYFDAMVDSVKAQSYGRWELCIADGSSNDTLQNHMEQKYAQDTRIRYRRLPENYGISGNMNAALELATGEYVGLFDHDDLLSPDALFEITSRLQEFPYDMIYTDEDKLNTLTGLYMDPHFKPDFALDQLRSHNYITHFLVVSDSILEQIGGLEPDLDGSQDYDFILRASEKANAVAHIPKILYHWRMHPSSTALNPESKLYCYQAGQKSLQNHLQRIGMDGTASCMPAPYYGLYRIQYPLDPNSCISIITHHADAIDQIADMKESLEKTNAWNNWELIIIDTGSQDPKVFEAYRSWKNQRNIRIIEQDAPCNPAAFFNNAAMQAKGDVLVFAAVGLQPAQPGSLQEIASQALRQDAGAVGAKLLDRHGNIASFGQLMDAKGRLHPLFADLEPGMPGYMGKALITQNTSLVSADCLAISKERFYAAGGFKEELGAWGYDADLCLRLEKQGLWNVLTPYAQFTLPAAGKTHTSDKEAYAARSRFFKRWKEVLQKGDPFYNPCFVSGARPYTIPTRKM